MSSQTPHNLIGMTGRAFAWLCAAMGGMIQFLGRPTLRLAAEPVYLRRRVHTQGKYTGHASETGRNAGNPWQR